MKLALVACLTFPLLAQVQPAGKAPQQRPHYEIAKEFKIQGTVTAVGARPMGPSKMVILTIQTADKSYDVFAAPEFVLSAKHISFAPGEKVTAIIAPLGSNLAAREITRDSGTFVILDKKGEPVNKPKPYDLTKEEILQGSVTAINTRAMGPAKVVVLTLRSTSKTVDIAVAPEQVLTAKHFSLAVGDNLTVFCAPTPMGVYTARQVSRTESTLTLLDKDGKPLNRPAKPDESPKK